jgi:hypothetical protein
MPLGLAPPHGARQFDRPAVEQEFLGQGGLAGVRMRDDRERPPSLELAGQVVPLDTRGVERPIGSILGEPSY